MKKLQHGGKKVVQQGRWERKIAMQQINSYDEFNDYFGIKPLYRFGLEHTIFARPDVAFKQAQDLHAKWNRTYTSELTQPDNEKKRATKDKLVIRGESQRVESFWAVYNNCFQKVIGISKDNERFQKALIEQAGLENVKVENFQCTHIFAANVNPVLVGSVWNMAFSPNMVVAMTDEHMSTDAGYYDLLKGVVWKLYRDSILAYQALASTVLNQISQMQNAINAYQGITAQELIDAWTVPNEQTVLAVYEDYFTSKPLSPDFTQEPIEGTSAIRIRFHEK